MMMTLTISGSWAPLEDRRIVAAALDMVFTGSAFLGTMTGAVAPVVWVS
jgi:hypothetical protein